MRETLDREIRFMLRGREAIADIKTMKAPVTHWILNYSGRLKKLGNHLTLEDPLEAMTTLLLIQNGII
jgi:hypothetical protein